MDFTAEANLIAALFVVDGQHIDKAAVLVRPDDFYDKGWCLFYQAMLTLRDRGEPIDAMGVFTVLKELKVSETEICRLVADCFNAFPMEGQVERYAKAVKTEARERRLRRTIRLAGERIEDGESPDEVKSELIDEIETADLTLVEQEDHHVSEATDKVLADLYDRMHGDSSKQGLKTGIAGLDEMTTGINREELWVVGGMPGRGKTAFALQTAINIAGQGRGVYYISLEMSRHSITRRLLAMKFGRGMVENPAGKQFEQLLAYKRELETLPLFINDASSLHIDELVARTRARILRTKLDLVIVDYLQLIRSDGRDRRERVGEATDRLRALAKQTGTPILALSQLRRPEHIDDRPTMIDLKESGDIEAHAHVVLLLYMPSDPEEKGNDEILVAKQREGPAGRVDVAFIGERGQFYERTK